MSCWLIGLLSVTCSWHRTTDTIRCQGHIPLLQFGTNLSDTEVF